MEIRETGMNEGNKPLEIESIPIGEVAEALRESALFAETTVADLHGVEQVERVTAKAGATLVESGDTKLAYWLVLTGKIRAERPEPDGSLTEVGTAQAGEGFGEAPLLMGKSQSVFLISAVEDTVLLRFTEDSFWSLLACCPTVRKVVLANMAQRMQVYQVEALHREKLVSLGTLAAVTGAL